MLFLLWKDCQILYLRIHSQFLFVLFVLNCIVVFVLVCLVVFYLLLHIFLMCCSIFLCFCLRRCYLFYELLFFLFRLFPKHICFYFYFHCSLLFFPIVVCYFSCDNLLPRLFRVHRLNQFFALPCWALSRQSWSSVVFPIHSIYSLYFLFLFLSCL